MLLEKLSKYLSYEDKEPGLICMHGNRKEALGDKKIDRKAQKVLEYLV